MVLHRNAETSIEHLLEPSGLSRLLGIEIDSVEQAPFATAGWSSTEAAFVGLCVNGEPTPSLVVKTVDRTTDWVAVGTRDVVDREVRLWESGLLDALHPPARHAVVGAARTPTHYSLVMDSVAAGLLPDGQVDDATHRLMIEAIAAMQAALWQSDQLLDPLLGLSSLDLFVGHTSPSTVDRIHRAMGESPVTEFITSGRGKLSSLIDSGLAATVVELANEPAPLVAEAEPAWFTLAHGDIRPANASAMDGSAILLDWARPMVAPPLLDLMYWLFSANDQHPEANEAWIELHRSRLEHHLGHTLDTLRWNQQVGVATAMVYTAMAQFMAHDPPPAFDWWTSKASQAIAIL